MQQTAPRGPAGPALALLAALSLPSVLPAQLDVPLRRYTSATFPNGLDFGYGFGIAVGDFDGDGWPDVFQANSGNLWRNLGGTGWKLFANINPLMPAAYLRYSASFGDF